MDSPLKLWRFRSSIPSLVGGEGWCMGRGSVQKVSGSNLIAGKAIVISLLRPLGHQKYRRPVLRPDVRERQRHGRQTTIILKLLCWLLQMKISVRKTKI